MSTGRLAHGTPVATLSRQYIGYGNKESRCASLCTKRGSGVVLGRRLTTPEAPRSTIIVAVKVDRAYALTIKA